jgi:hypothetical protein
VRPAAARGVVACRGCSAPIRFVLTMPVEVMPVETWLIPRDTGPGLIVLIDREGRTHRGLPCARPPHPDGHHLLVQGYLPHWSSCGPERRRVQRGGLAPTESGP